MTSYSQILSTTSLFGAVSVLGILLRILRAKTIAVWLGPTGIGILALYQAFVGTVSGVAGLGTDVSGVRQLASARGQEDSLRIVRIRSALVFVAISFGGLATLLMLIYRAPLAELVLGDATQAYVIGWLSLGVLLSITASLVLAYLRGFRAIKNQAGQALFSEVLGTLLAIGLVVWLGKAGILPFVVLMPLIGLVAAIYFARKIRVEHQQVGFSDTWKEAVRLVRLGFLIMLASSLVGWAVLYLLSDITRTYGTEMTGIFQAAWAVSFIYIGFLVDAMATDYLPRLAEVSTDHEKMCQFVDEQQLIALLLGATLLIGMMTFAPLIISILYSRDFHPAVPIVQAMVLGNLLKLFGWPMGFCVVAKGQGSLFMFTQSLWVILFLVFTWQGMELWGINGIGLAFSLVYVVTVPTVYVVVRNLIGYRINFRNLRIAAMIGLGCLIQLLLSRHSANLGYSFGTIAALFAAFWTYRELTSILGQRPIAMLRKQMGQSQKGVN